MPWRVGTYGRTGRIGRCGTVGAVCVRCHRAHRRPGCEWGVGGEGGIQRPVCVLPLCGREHSSSRHQPRVVGHAGARQCHTCCTICPWAHATLNSHQVNRRVTTETNRPSGAKVSSLSMYSVPPTEKLSVTEFEEFAFDRLRRVHAIRPLSPNPRLPPLCLDGVCASHQCAIARLLVLLMVPACACARTAVLNMIDMARAKGLKGDDLDKTIRKARDECMPNTMAGVRKDHLSHFILRLAYCRRRGCPPVPSTRAQDEPPAAASQRGFATVVFAERGRALQVALCE